MMEPRLKSMPILTPAGFSQLAWAEWGPDAPVKTVLCVHGLTRNGRDFDVLATALAAEGWRVVAPDMPGRGRSPRLRVQDYTYPVYAGVIAALLARLAVDSVDWVGTSMGGIIGMSLAALPGAPIRRLLLNDVGAFIPRPAIARILDYAGGDKRFDDRGAAERYLRQVHAPFGALTDEQWRHMALYSSLPADGGGFRLHYDPAIIQALAAAPADDVVLWPLWEPIACPTLILRGAESDLLLRDTAQEMTRRGAAAAKGLVRLQEIAGAGHAPALMAADQIAMVRDFLADDAAVISE
jgi:pimeloyl-ACP methyl ester carboxylesterase